MSFKKDYTLAFNFLRTSAHSEIAYTKQGNDYFINVAAIQNGADTYSASVATTLGGTVAVASSLGTAATIVNAGGLLVKDMGKTVTSTAGDVYRKVQALSVQAGGASAVDTSFYIKAVPASGSVSEWARMNLQNA